jgi:CPA1 family monovalent cation:H+ antiporter
LDTFNLLALFITLAAVFGWVNLRYVRLPATIGLMVISLLFSLVLVVLGRAGVADTDWFTGLVATLDFDETLLKGMLGALLFAGALHIDINDLLNQKWVISLLATVGVLTSTLLVGSGAWLLFGWLGMEIPFLFALLFGALISPTDPIAVGAILRKAGVPHSLLTKITGESLFNDGVGVVLFIVILELATGGGGHATAEAATLAAGSGHAGSGTASINLPQVLHLLGMEVLGGLAFGGVLGWVAYRMLRAVDAYQVEIGLTLAIVTGGYALASALHISGPLAMVVAGLLVGNRGRALAMSRTTVEHLDSFWEMVDEILNAVLFVMIGVEVLLLDFAPTYLLAGLAAIPLVLGARLVSVSLPVQILKRFRSFTPHVVKILTWSGLRGGISVALALSLPPGQTRNLLVSVTYVVVVFSIVVQGLTVGAVTRRLTGESSTSALDSIQEAH